MGKSETAAFVGIALSNNVIYNVVHREGEFGYTGMSIIRFLNTNKNKFLSLIMESQSYDGIDTILDDAVNFGPFKDTISMNVDTFSDIHALMVEGEEITEYYYIYDVYEDVLLVKTPDRNEMIALDYKNSKDIRDFSLI